MPLIEYTALRDGDGDQSGTSGAGEGDGAVGAVNGEDEFAEDIHAEYSKWTPVLLHWET